MDSACLSGSLLIYSSFLKLRFWTVRFQGFLSKILMCSQYAADGLGAPDVA